MEKIKIHPWVTENGRNTMLSTKENCPEDQSPSEDIDGVFKPAFLGQVKSFMFGKQRKSDPQVSPSTSRGIKETMVKVLMGSETSINGSRKEGFAINNKSF
jgi:hypothetical protein